MRPILQPACRLLFTVIGLVLLSACASKPTVDYDTAYSFAGLHSFVVDSPVKPGDPLLAERLVRDITATLKAKGFAQADTRVRADFVATYQSAVSERPNSSRIGIGIGGGSFGGHSGISTGASVGFPLGSSTVQYLLIHIDMADRSSGRVIWRGAKEVKIPSGAKGEARTAATTQTVTAILAGFPPH